MSKQMQKNHRGEPRHKPSGYYEEWGSLLPPPAILESYEEVSKGFGANLASMLSSEQKHRHNLEIKWLSHLKAVLCFAQIVACLSIMFSIGFAGFLVFKEAKWQAIAVSLSSGIMCFIICGVFVVKKASLTYVKQLIHDRGIVLKGERAVFMEQLKKIRFFKKQKQKAREKARESKS